jgi:hypothetical protein
MHFFLIILLTLAVASPFAQAQPAEEAQQPELARPGSPPREPGEGGRFGRGPREGHVFRDEMGNEVDPRELLEQVMTARLSKELALDEQQTVVLVRRFTEFREEMHALRMERGRILRDLRQATRTAQDEEAITENLAALMELDERAARARRELFESASGGYTPWQRARLYIFMTEFEGDMRRMVQRARERHEGGPGDGGSSRWERRDGYGPRGGDGEEEPEAEQPAG